MANPVYDITNLDATNVETYRTLLRQAITDYTGQADLNRGVVHDMVLELTSVLTAAIEQDIDKVRSEGSFQYLIDNPSAASASAVSNVLTNFRIVRGSAVKAKGQIAVVLSAGRVSTINKGAVFQIGDLLYSASGTYTARLTSAEVKTNNDRLLTQIGTSNYYYFIVDVVCNTEGTVGNVPGGVEATLTTKVPLRYYKSYTYGGITGGKDAETNSQLMARLLNGWAIKAWGSRTSINSLFKNKFPNIAAISVVGASDSEMLRDRTDLFPVSSGGRTDIYTRYSTGYSVIAATLEATLESKVGAVGTWRINIGKDVAPGFYDVKKVLLTTQNQTATGFTLNSDIRSLDLTGTGYVPDLSISFPVEGVYSRYQTSTIRFADNITNATALTPEVAKQNYTVLLRYMPELASMQDYLGNINRRPISSDVLVKAPIPVFCTLTCDVTVPTASTVVNKPDLLRAIVASVNAQGFSNKLSASLVYTGVEAAIPGSKVSNVVFTGTLRKPSGTLVTLTPGSELTVADDLTVMVSSKTVVFYLPSTDVTVNIIYPS